MKIRARIMGVFGVEPVVAEKEVELKDGITLKKFFRRVDKAMGFKRPRYFRLSLKQGPEPTILLNGDRVALPEAFRHKLNDGDEITVMTPMMGG